MRHREFIEVVRMCVNERRRVCAARFSKPTSCAVDLKAISGATCVHIWMANPSAGRALGAVVCDPVWIDLYMCLCANATWCAGLRHVYSLKTGGNFHTWSWYVTPERWSCCLRLDRVG